MGKEKLEIDFSKSIDDWMELINNFIAMIVDFLKVLGIKLFDDDPEETTVAGE